MTTILLKLFIITFSLIISAPSIQSVENYDKYEGYKLYDINFSNEKQMLKFYEHFKDSVDIIIPSRIIKKPMRILISPDKVLKITEYSQSNAINFNIINENIAETIRNEKRVKRNIRNSTTGIINFQNYQRFDVINNYMEHLQKQYPERVKIMNIGKSYEGRDLNAILITKNDIQQMSFTKPLILIDAGIHAREWIAPATALYIIQQLVENATYYEQELEMYDWLIWPIVNPDGYEYSHDYNRLWRKTRKPSETPNLSECVGVDINRNFDFYWSYSGGSENQCSDTYQGSKAFSEPEAQALRDLLLKINTTCNMYLTLHSYGNYILYPWGYKSSLPSSWKYLDAVAHAGSSAIRESFDTSYTVGGAANILYAASGASDDYAFAIANISVVLCMELPSGGNGFDPPSDKILPIVAESWSGIRAMALEVQEYPLRNKANCKYLNLLALFFLLNILVLI